jgi:exodeoxyribonuclease V alpha subunit
MEKRLNVVSVTYQGDNGYTILLCDEVNEGGRAINCSLTCVGYFLPASKNRIFRATLEEVNNKKYGKQYNVLKFEAEDPKDKIGIIDVIVSCKLKGIGRKKAERIFEKYGASTLKVLDEDFMRIRELSHMPKDLETPMKQWKNSRDLRELISMVGNSENITQGKLLKIRSYFKEKSVEVIKTRPYDVMQIHGIDFYTADAIALHSEEYHYNYMDCERIKAGIKQSLLDSMLDGHLYLFTSQIIPKAKEILRYENYYVNDRDIQIGLNLLVKAGEVVFFKFTTDFAFYLKANYKAEQESAEKLINMVFNSKKEKVDKDKIKSAICKHENADNIKLANGQRNAVINALISPVSIITGGAGRGKTTVLNMILKVYKEFNPKKEIFLMAPTGRAARRMAEATGMDASTIHSALGLRSDEELNNYDNDITLPADLVIIDEMSMVDMKLFSLLVSRLKPNCKFVMVGDKDQLASVGAGDVFAQLISSNVIPTTVLDTPFRQDENDLVFINAEKINNGDTRLIEGITFKFIEASGEEEIRDKCLSIYKDSLVANNNNLDSIFLLSPFRRRSEIGSDQLNKYLQQSVNRNANSLVVNVYGKSFCKGDKVMHTKNITTDDGLTLSNGDIGYITEVSVGTENNSSVTVEYEGIGVKEYSGHEDFDMLELAYATTVHKSQGSEAETVIMPMSNIFSVMLKRNLVYTSVSRAKKTCIVIGSRSALNRAILNTNYEERNTLLGWRLINMAKDYMPKSKDKEDIVKPEYNQLSFV